MFKIECFCDDKKLPEVMHALSGKVLEPPKVYPVANGAAKNGKVGAKVEGDLVDLLVDHMKGRKIKTIAAAQLKEFMTSIGRAPTGYHKLVAEAAKAKVMKRVGKGLHTAYSLTGGR